MEKKSIFVCSSSDGLDIALSLKKSLEDQYEVEAWKEGAFGIGQTYLESLNEASKRCQFVILVLTPYRKPGEGCDEELPISQNVLFEIGYFIGIFGRSRTFILLEKTHKVQLPSYLDGISLAEVERGDSPDVLDVLLKPAVSKIRTALAKKCVSANDVLLRKLVTDAICVACQALASPFTAEEAKLRVFVFKKEDTKLTCTYFWAPYDVSETEGISFEINPETMKQVAVVMAATKKRNCKVSISVLPEDMDGVQGNIDRNLRFIHATPILGPKNEVWGTVDFDASHWKGENILRNETCDNVLLQLGKNLYNILSKIS